MLGQVKEGSVDPESAILENNAVRVPPPHINPSETLTEGVVEPEAGVLVDVAPRSEHLPVSTLAHGLDRVLFNPGVHWLQDPRSHVYNFTPWLEKIPKVNDFAFERLTGFVKSSRDEDLRALAKQEEKKFAGSTSSMSGMLSHIYFLISEYKDVELSTLSQHFSKEATGFTSGQRIPATVTLNYQDGIYAIDSRSDEYDDPDKNVLTWLGTLLENFLTKTPAQFNKFMRLESAPIEKDEKPMMREAFRFAKSDKFVMRSQLDCQDKRLPGTGVFDIKTRACISIRMDILNYEENAGYMIKSQHGLLESFEREYYDLIRSAFLKYSFQVRIGNMDGVMVAYHNTERIFGFQYISLDEMDERLYGPVPGIGDKVFNKCVGLLEAILEEATKCFPEQSVLCAFETRQPGKGMDVFVQPAEWNEQGEERPLKQLLVRVQNELDGESVRPAAALRSTTQKWTMKYSISEVVLPKDIIKNNLKSLEQRKSRTLVLPTSVALDDAKEYWEKLNYSNQLIAAEDLKEFRPEAFTIATAQVQRYRDLAREGRALYKELERRQAGKPKIVLGQGVYEEEESLFFKDPHSESEMDQELEPSTPRQEQESYAPSEPASAESNLHDKSDEE
ncbi:mitochondrial protein Pet127-domain-containing protein [Flammula alnicola]|nr:mitochondrial protein Pet127-domain-containing protein [Flammula alnicola]